MRLKLLSLALSIDGLGQAPWHSDPAHPEESPQACSGPVPHSIIYPWIPGCQKYICSQHVCGAGQKINAFAALHRWETIFSFILQNLIFCLESCNIIGYWNFKAYDSLYRRKGNIANKPSIICCSRQCMTWHGINSFICKYKKYKDIT